MVKIVSPPAALRKKPPKASSRRSRWNPREKLTLTVKHRGGAESWWEVQARGETFRFPGHVYIEDVMAVIHSGR